MEQIVIDFFMLNLI